MISGEYRVPMCDVGVTIYGPEDCPAIYDLTGVVSWHATEPVGFAAVMFTFGDRVLIMDVSNPQELDEFASMVWQANELLGRMMLSDQPDDI